MKNVRNNSFREIFISRPIHSYPRTEENIAKARILAVVYAYIATRTRIITRIICLEHNKY